MNVRLASIAALLGMAFTTQGAMASSIPVPDPPTCSWCDGPPPPPLLVPTVAPTEVAPVGIISVSVSPTHLQPGQTVTVKVMADAQDQVTAVVHYPDTKPKTYKAQIGDSRALTKSWKIPASVGPGKAQIKVTVDGGDGPYSTTISFEVVK